MNFNIMPILKNGIECQSKEWTSIYCNAKYKNKEYNIMLTLRNFE